MELEINKEIHNLVMFIFLLMQIYKHKVTNLKLVFVYRLLFLGRYLLASYNKLSSSHRR